MSERGLPKAGDRILVEKFHVSPTNMRAEEVFGESEEDRNLINQLRRGEIIEPFTARPEDKEGHWTPGRDLSEAVGYGVVVGRRRCLGKKEVGVKFFVVGNDCLVKEMTDEEAEEASWIENLPFLKKDVDPVARAEGLNKIISRSTGGLRGKARHWGIPPSSLSEWLSPLKLSQKMQEALRKGLVSFSDSLIVTRMKLGEAMEDKLAEMLETEGLAAFKRELARIPTGKMKRGIPKDVYEIDRIVWDKRNRKVMGYYEIIVKAAKAKGFEKVPEYEQDFLIRHIDEIKREGKTA